jgi:predicted DsbA family dithiol-disulfide isomerase
MEIVPQMSADRPELRVTVFSDFICPFCYIGFRRLEALRDEYDLKVNWRFLEIHPETPADGGRFSDYDYSEEQRQMMEDALAELAASEHLVFQRRVSVANSHRALCLAEVAKRDGAEVFYRLSADLFDAYFSKGKDIGSEVVLRELAQSAGMSSESIQAAWEDPAIEAVLTRNLASAIELGVGGTPTFFFGARRITGAVPREMLRAAAIELLAGEEA